MKEEVIVDKKGKCLHVYIPKKYCCIFLQNQAEDHIEISKVGADLCIENLSSDLPCQTHLKE